jgi:tRNA (guanine-N7-)-methyltransferase
VRVRQHVNPESPFFERMALAPLALDARPVELEIGCAEAQFLFERARQDPGRRYVGLEIRDRMVRWVNQQARLDGLPVEAIFCHANHHLATLFGPGSVDRVYLNFPDPWFKRKHHERRMIDPGLAEAIAVIARPGAELLFQSDVWEIALDAMAAFDAMDDRFDNLAGPWSFWRGPHPFGVRSWREQHCEEDGLPIWRLRYRRRPVAGEVGDVG